MFAVYLALAGLLAFTIGAGVAGPWLTAHATRENAERSSRVLHFLFFAGLVAPPCILIFYPGLTHLDALLRVNSLPMKLLLLGVGIMLMLPGLSLLAVSNWSLRVSGRGANAFLLTKQVVARDIYQYTRNPMSLGFYLCSLGIALVSGSTVATCAALLGYIPAHIFFLKFFEERELELRFGKSYELYRARVPFLIPRLSAGHASGGP